MPSRRLFLAALLAASAAMVEAAGAQGNGMGGSGNGSGSDNGNGAGNGNGNAGGESTGGSENASGNEAVGEAAAPKVEKPSNVPRNLRLRHRNGFEEEIGAGRYEMRDNRGRRIVNRAARASDYARLRRLMRWRPAG